MFASLVGLIHQPSVAIRVPNDDTTFNPKEYPNIVFTATGKVQGKVRIIHGTDDYSDLGMISSRIWVTKENDKHDVAIRPSFEKKTLTFTLEGPTQFASFNVYHETTIIIPDTFEYMENLTVDSPNTSFSAEKLDYLRWSNVSATLSNSVIALQSLHASSINLRTSNSSISGTYEAGHVHLITSNGSISAKLTILEPVDGEQSKAVAKTSNSSITLHVDATATTSGLWMENTTKNGKIVVGTLLGPSTRGSTINTSTDNSKIEFNLDASQTGQPLEVTNRTSNSSIVSSIMVPQYQPFKGKMQTSNSSISVNLTEDFTGRFDLQTSNSNATVEGSNLRFDEEKKSHKRGSRGNGNGDVNISSSNSSIALRFYPCGDSLAADKIKA